MIVIAVGVTEALFITLENVRKSEPVLRSNEKLTRDGFCMLGVTLLACRAAFSSTGTTGLKLRSRTAIMLLTMDRYVFDMDVPRVGLSCSVITSLASSLTVSTGLYKGPTSAAPFPPNIRST